MKQSELTDEQRKYYLAHGGNYCPICHGQSLHDRNEQTEDGGTIWQYWFCADCGAEWTDEFALTNVWLEEG